MPTIETGDIVTYSEEPGSNEPQILIGGLGADGQA